MRGTGIQERERFGAPVRQGSVVSFAPPSPRLRVVFDFCPTSLLWSYEASLTFCLLSFAFLY